MAFNVPVTHDSGASWDWPLSAGDGVVKVREDDKHFEVGLEAHFFTPKEIDVKASGDLLEIHLEHNAKNDQYGNVSRSITRCYKLPGNVDKYCRCCGDYASMCGKSVKWEKILYRAQPFPDNYSGGEKQFLKELRKNVSVVRYDYWTAVRGSLVFVSHLDTIALYFVLFLETLHSNWAPHILTIVFSIIVFCYLFYCAVLAEPGLLSMDHGRTITTLFLFGYSFTPIIRTLTTTISTDTIYAVSIISAALSCVFHDYGVKAPIVSYPISMSSGLSSAIFLLSRLDHNTPAFLLLVIAFVLHAYESDFRNRMFLFYPNVSIAISLCLAVASAIFIMDFSANLAIFWTIFHFFVVLVCPYILMCKQSTKCTIHGPWDEAVPLK
ncbi:unnamed protein product [Caenorhabditis bovis]|uniref:SHSP domain-containing protein n=1 Tax=Caenorhabditis bovis TaxID=2654633 RepID=A0A8S1F8G0_9PELO|nr:unnamed protein product [Caenorhabditis bovis]